MSEVNPRAAWWAQSYGFPGTLDGARAALRHRGTWEFQAFIARCSAQARSLGMRPASDPVRFNVVVQREAIADTLRRFPA